ncbi:MAG: hypothetical protein COX65_10120 [Elusimicrobia bacterium CG_4_10_14_0_2_um_filter_56_8]|nr:MAG: hypothetical protein AUJ51_07570 [Elusimicrobia bacterium CG1_02_56_21]PJA11589.1 MAG: hypothetical protein COX65_10120 [Elusimicrobia bacterium CG_4_10_14_0_2_um_filter_56_8]
MQPLRRSKVWLPGTAKNINSVSCDLYGMKTEEAEYDGKTLVLKNSFIYKDKDESRELCRQLKSREKLTTSFSSEAQSSMDDFCRKYSKKDFGVVLVYDASPSQGRETSRKPVRQVFRLFNKRGFVVAEHSFDPLMNLESVTLYSYDKANNLTGLTVNDFDGRQMKREAYSWSKATNSRTYSVYGGNNELRKKTVFENREDGTLRREVRSTYDSGEQPVTRSEIYHDAKGRPEKELVYDADAAGPKYEITYTYKYDAKGNWTEERKTREIVYNGKRMQDTQHAPEITLRELMYY